MNVASIKMAKQWIHGYNHSGYFIFTIECPESVPELGNTPFSSGSKTLMADLADKLSAKYGWNIEKVGCR